QSALRTRRPGKPQRLVQPLAFARIGSISGRLNSDREPRGMHEGGQALGIADDGRGARVGTDAGEDALPGRPRVLCGLSLRTLARIPGDPLRLRTRALARRNPRLKEVLHRGPATCPKRPHACSCIRMLEELAGTVDCGLRSGRTKLG